MTLPRPDNRLPTKTLMEAVASIKRGLSSYHVKEQGKAVRIVNIKDIQDGQINVADLVTTHIDEASAEKECRIDEGDVLLTIKGPTFKAAVAMRETSGLFFSANILAIRPNSSLEAALLCSFLNSEEGQRQLRARATGAVISSLTPKAILDIPIPMLSAKQQKALAAYLALATEYRSLLRRELELSEKIESSLISKIVKV